MQQLNKTQEKQSMESNNKTKITKDVVKLIEEV